MSNYYLRSIKQFSQNNLFTFVSIRCTTNIFIMIEPVNCYVYHPQFSAIITNGIDWAT